MKTLILNGSPKAIGVAACKEEAMNKRKSALTGLQK